MPILTKNNKICHFVHIPKCAGSSIEHYCEKEDIKIAFLDRTLNSSLQSWNISSPQHIDGYSLSRLFPVDFFDLGFAVVRDPISRFLSAFKHQLFQKKIPSNTSINLFIKDELLNLSNEIGAFDNHFLPQSKFLIPGMNYQIFKLENGMDNIKRFIDTNMLGFKSNENILHYNADRSKNIIKPGQLEMDLNAITRLKDFYIEDYSLFKY
tara:strand:+ start:448 stop:1074 length:627 start_codon:yes stop_codon:yes gene_type:complete